MPIVADRTRLGLMADEPADAALLRRVRTLQRSLDRHLRSLARRINVRSVHEARIAARRLRVVLRGFARVLDPAIARPYRRAATELADALASVRDADVAVQQYDAFIESDAPASVRARLVGRRTRARAALRAAMRSPAWRRRSVAMRAAAASPTLVMPTTLSAGALTGQVLDRRRRRTRRALRALRDPRRHRRKMHRVRLAIKALRYLEEECRPAHAGSLAREIDGLHELQDLLGEWRDLEALRDELDEPRLRRRCDRRARVLCQGFRVQRQALLRVWRRR